MLPSLGLAILPEDGSAILLNTKEMPHGSSRCEQQGGNVTRMGSALWPRHLALTHAYKYAAYARKRFRLSARTPVMKCLERLQEALYDVVTGTPGKLSKSVDISGPALQMPVPPGVLKDYPTCKLTGDTLFPRCTPKLLEQQATERALLD